MGSRVIPELLRRGHRVRALAREGSPGRLPEDASGSSETPWTRDLRRPASRRPTRCCSLVGVAHPSPAKAAEFRSVDLASASASAKAAAAAGISHIVYVSVAQPAPVMKAYVEARAEGEVAIRATRDLTRRSCGPGTSSGPATAGPISSFRSTGSCSSCPPTRDSGGQALPRHARADGGALVARRRASGRRHPGRRNAGDPPGPALPDHGVEAGRLHDLDGEGEARPRRDPRIPPRNPTGPGGSRERSWTGPSRTPSASASTTATRLIGFTRVITDNATFGYLADVFVLESHRGRGLATWFMETVMAHPDLQGIRRWMLVTRGRPRPLPEGRFHRPLQARTDHGEATARSLRPGPLNSGPFPKIPGVQRPPDGCIKHPSPTFEFRHPARQRRNSFCIGEIRRSRMIHRPRPRSARLFSSLLPLFLLALALLPSSALATSSTIVISQVYGGGGNSGATLQERLHRALQPGRLDGGRLRAGPCNTPPTAGTSWQQDEPDRLDRARPLLPGQGSRGSRRDGRPSHARRHRHDRDGATAGKVALVNNQTTDHERDELSFRGHDRGFRRLRDGTELLRRDSARPRP